MKILKFNLFFLKKKTKEEQIDHRINDVFNKMISDADFSFTQLELVHICNGINEMLRIYLDESISNDKSESINRQQKANETIHAKSFLK